MHLALAINTDIVFRPCLRPLLAWQTVPWEVWQLYSRGWQLSVNRLQSIQSHSCSIQLHNVTYIFLCPVPDPRQKEVNSERREKKSDALLTEPNTPFTWRPGAYSVGSPSKRLLFNSLTQS